MGSIIFEKSQGGLNRSLPGEDHISGLLIYSSELPAGFSVTDRIKEVYDLLHAESLGITDESTTMVFIRIIHYHISEFFRINPGAKLFVAIYPEPASVFTFTEIENVQNYADGKIKQIGIYTKIQFDKAHLTLIQGVVTKLDDQHKPLSALYAADLKDVTTTAMENLRLLTNPKVSGILGQDGKNKGASLFNEALHSITCIGAALGAVSKSKVNECIGWVKKFDISAVELDVPALANGELIKTISENILLGLDVKGWIFLRKYSGIAGTYFNDSHCACELTSDYSYIEKNRTIDKAIRGVRAYLLPELNAPILINAQTGQLSTEYVTHLELTGDKALEQMERDGELSGYKTFVNPDQNVLSTDEVEIIIRQVPVGVSRNFKVKIGFTNRLQ